MANRVGISPAAFLFNGVDKEDLFVSANKDLFDKTAGEKFEIFTCGIAVNHKYEAEIGFSYKQKGFLTTTYGRDFIFNRLWFSPTEIDAGFITEDQITNIEIWNAWEDEQLVFSMAAGVDSDGTTLLLPKLPRILQPGAELTLPLTVHEVGPAIQATVWTITIGGVDYQVVVSGIRVLSMAVPPNWESPLSLTYRFDSVMFQTERFHEQRRPMFDLPIRILSAKYLVQARESQVFFNLASYAHDKLFGVPIYNEMLVPTQADNGDTTIKLATPTADMYNLNNNAEYVMIIDHANEVGEIKGIDTISANEIETTRPITGAYAIKNIRVYPIFFGLLKRIGFSEATDRHSVVELEFEEFIN